MSPDEWRALSNVILLGAMLLFAHLVIKLWPFLAAELDR